MEISTCVILTKITQILPFDELRKWNAAKCPTASWEVAKCPTASWKAAKCPTASWLMGGCKISEGLMEGCKMSDGLMEGCKMSDGLMIFPLFFGRGVGWGVLDILIWPCSEPEK